MRRKLVSKGSVMNGVNFLTDKACLDDTVLFHFGASPFITPDIIADVIRVCKEKGTNAISTTDYLLLSGMKKSTKTVLDPENYIAALSQSFSATSTEKYRQGNGEYVAQN